MFEPIRKEKNVCVRFNLLFNFIRFVPSTRMIYLDSFDYYVNTIVIFSKVINMLFNTKKFPAK